MPTIKKITVYTFAELSDKAKDKARQWYCKGIDVEQWSECTIEDAERVGIKIKGFDVGRRSIVDGTIEDTESTAHAIVKEHGETCTTFKTATGYLRERGDLIEGWKGDQDLLDEKLDEMGEEFTEAILADYLQLLCEAYEYEYSDECVDDNIEANEYTFTKDGERF